MMIQISSDKIEKMSEIAEKMLKYGGKLMTCIEELSEGRGNERMGRRENWDDDDDEETNYRRGGYRSNSMSKSRYY